MRTFETTDSKVARRCRYDQHRRQKTIVKIGEGSSRARKSKFVAKVFDTITDFFTDTLRERKQL
jgi:hypothetical protein